MTRFTLMAICGGVLLVVTLLASLADASGCNFSFGYKAQAVSYAQPVVAPLQIYSYQQPAQAVILPGKVTYTAPQVTYQLQQVVAQEYAAPVVVQPYALRFSQYYGAQFRQKQVLPLKAHVQDNRVVNEIRGPLGIRTQVQADGDLVRRGPAGRVLRIDRNR